MPSLPSSYAKSQGTSERGGPSMHACVFISYLDRKACCRNRVSLTLEMQNIQTLPQTHRDLLEPQHLSQPILYIKPPLTASHFFESRDILTGAGKHCVSLSRS